MENTARRWRFCAALLVTAMAAGCTENPTSPIGKSAPQSAAKTVLSGDPFFIAWSASYSSDPIQTQVWSGPDAREYRQYTGMYADGGLLAFAAANPGKLYINGDEPDQSCISPYDYAGIYHDYVAALRGADPSARVSPAGFAEPNDVCCNGDPDCFNNMHSVGYADQFYNRYFERYSVVPPVDEWRFHDFGLGYQGNIAAWWSRVSSEAAWSVSHGANMVLGSWGFLNWDEPWSTFQSHMQEAMNLVRNDGRINQAVWWSYENTGNPHYLANADGTLTPEGQTYANPVTQIPSGVTLAGSSGAHAKLRWTNTSSIWGIEAEFWVQPGGSGSFVYNNTDLVAAGGTETPVEAFTLGDRVQGRARYYSGNSVGSWSPFSNIVFMH
jgi:hypothetical protein